MKFQLFLLVTVFSVIVSAKTGGWKQYPTAAPVEDDDDDDYNKHHKKHWWFKELFMNKISSCPHDDSCALFSYQMKDCDRCEVVCTNKVFTKRDAGYVCNSQSYCPCGSHSNNKAEDTDEEWLLQDAEEDANEKDGKN